MTYGTPVSIWSVRSTPPFRCGATTGAILVGIRPQCGSGGRIIAAGMKKEVTFEPVDGPINDRIDNAYRAKYHDSPYLSPMIGALARSATVKVMPRGE